MPEIKVYPADYARAYEVCDTSRAIDAVAEMTYNHTNPVDVDMILLNGPPGSGKTWLAHKLKNDYFPPGWVEIITVPETIYALMQHCTYRDEYGLTSQIPLVDLPYDEFKHRPGGREAIIAVANRLRFADPRIVDKAVFAAKLKDETKVVIVDNVGSAAEAEYLTQACTRWFLITIKRPYSLLPDHRASEADKAEQRRQVVIYESCYNDNSYWPDDIRYPLNPALVAGYNGAASYVALQYSVDIEWFIQSFGTDNETSWLKDMIADGNHFPTLQDILPLDFATDDI